MSIEAASEFLNKAKQDSKLQRQLDDCPAQEDGLQSFIEIAAQHGCEFTTEEFAELIQPADGALSDDQLDQVAGGFGFLAESRSGRNGRTPSDGALETCSRATPSSLDHLRGPPPVRSARVRYAGRPARHRTRL